LLAINNWDKEYERVFLGGQTCDSHDYYNSEANLNAVFLPKFSLETPQYIGLFHTGAYQESIGGYWWDTTLFDTRSQTRDYLS
jgi:arginine decarboxylase